MNITVLGKGITIGDQLRSKVETKLNKYNRYFGDEAVAQVKIKPEGDEKCVEITIRVEHQHHIYRSEALGKDVFMALDFAVDNLERQIRKQKTRIEKRIREYAYMKEALHQEMASLEYDGAKEQEIIKRKSFALTAMTGEEATLQMELLGHSFLLFLNVETGKVALVYKRKDGHYGLIEPEY